MRSSFVSRPRLSETSRYARSVRTGDVRNRNARGRPPGSSSASGAGRERKVPRVEPHLLGHLGQQELTLLALDRHRAQPPAAIPRQDLVRAPAAERAVFVVEEGAASSCALRFTDHSIVRQAPGARPAESV